MGQVYLAGQREPLRRQVALKIVAPELGLEEVVERFRAGGVATMRAGTLRSGKFGRDAGSGEKVRSGEARRGAGDGVEPTKTGLGSPGRRAPERRGGLDGTSVGDGT
ncbi:MAG TPA: hypothetical protein VFI25_19240 [Planctomycetota bacterium]|jgi:hypothetical protein|nr:hypothetical protein [Planctomycetota bacterium]